MASVLERKLIVMTGKGGVGKTTLAAAVGLLAARRGLRTIVVEVSGAGSDAGAAGRLAALLGHSQPPPHGEEVELGPHLYGLSIDRDRVLAEWLRALGGRVPARVLTSSASFQYLIAAAPGAREMISMVKVWELAHDRRPAARARGGAGEANAGDARGAAGDPRDATGEPRRGTGDPRGARGYDLVVLDAPATGHALAMLRAPHLFGAIARVGPIARQARQVRELLEDPELSAYIGVAQATEMATSETLDLRESLRRELGRDLHRVIVNGALPRRFAGADLHRIAELHGAASSAPPVARSATRAALAVHERARTQQNQIARLRRHGMSVLTIPFSFQSELDLAAVQRIADRLDREL